MTQLRRKHAVIVVCAIAGVQLADLFTSSTPVRSSTNCPGYQLGDLNRWAEAQGKALRGEPKKPAYYEMPVAPTTQSFAPTTPMPPVVAPKSIVPATVAESKGLTEQQWQAGLRTAPKTDEQQIDAGIFEVNSAADCVGVPAGMRCQVVGAPVAPAPSQGGQNVAL